MNDGPDTPPYADYPGLHIAADRAVWDGRFPLREVRFSHRQFDGSQSRVFTWYLWQRGRAAALLPYDPVADAVVLIEQFRFPALAAGIDPLLIEVPAGLCDPGETPEVAAIREMREETGLAVDRLERVGEFMPSPGGCDERIAVFAGRVAVPAADAQGRAGRGGLAGEEDLRILVWPAERAIEAALAGAFANATITIALLWLAARRDWLRTQWARP